MELRISLAVGCLAAVINLIVWNDLWEEFAGYVGGQSMIIDHDESC